MSLPFKCPNFAWSQSAGAAELAMIGHSTAYNQLLNQAIPLRCNRKFINGFTTPQVTVPNIYIQYYNFIERYGVNFRYVYDYCLDIIKAMLNDKMYIYYHAVDDFYLPGKSWYGTRHMHHDGVICGYDDNDETISIAAHDINWVYRLIRVPQRNFLEALRASLSMNEYGNMTAYKVRDNTFIQLNEKEMLKFLKEYIDSSFEKYPIDIDGEVRGVVVHDYLAMYMDKLKDGSIPYEKMDWRAVRPVWEHKKCMLDRIVAVEKKNSWGNELSELYTSVVDKANRIRMMYAMYHKNHNDKLLDKIHDGLLALAVSDREIVGEFTNRLEELVK